MVSNASHLRALAAIALAILTCSAWGARLEAITDRTQLATTEHLILTLSLYDSDTRLRAEGVSPNIDLTLLSPDFHVGSIKPGFRYNAYRNRGRASSELVVELFPLREGRLIIPPFEIDNARSTALEVEVRPAIDAASPLVFARSGITPEGAYAQQQVIAYLDMYYRVQMESAKLGGDLETEPVALELLEHYRLPNSERVEVVDGIEYNVLRSAWALFPKGAQPLRLYFPDVWVVTRDGDKRRLPHGTHSLEPRALPTATLNLPIGEITAEVTRPTDHVSVGQAAVWRIHLRGAVSRFVLPPKLSISSPSAITLFEDQAEIAKDETANGVVHSATYTVTAIGGQPGTVALAPLRLDYFDPRTGTVQQREYPLGTAVFQGQALAATPPVSSAGRATPAQMNEIPWPILTAIFGGLWLVTLVTTLAFWTRIRGPAPPKAGLSPMSHRNAATRPLLDRLVNLLHSRDLDEGIRSLERARGPQPELRTLVYEIQKYYFGAEKSGTEQDLRRRIEELVRAGLFNASPAAEKDRWDPRGSLEPPFRSNQTRPSS